MDVSEQASLLRQQGFRPNVLAETIAGERVELISYPYPEGEEVHIKVRMTPGDPTTLATKSAADLKILS